MLHIEFNNKIKHNVLLYLSVYYIYFVIQILQKTSYLLTAPNATLLPPYHPLLPHCPLRSFHCPQGGGTAHFLNHWSKLNYYPYLNLVLAKQGL